MPEIPRCSECGAPIDPERGECVYCRKPQGARRRSLPEPAEQKKSPKHIRRPLRRLAPESLLDSAVNYAADRGCVVPVIGTLALLALIISFLGMSGNLKDDLRELGLPALLGLGAIVGFLYYRARIRRGEQGSDTEGDCAGPTILAETPVRTKGPERQPERGVGLGNLRRKSAFPSRAGRSGWVRFLAFAGISLALFVLIWWYVDLGLPWKEAVSLGEVCVVALAATFLAAVAVFLLGDKY